MRLELHQLERRWEHLRVRHPARQRRLLASLAEGGQQTPIVLVAIEGQPDRYVIIDGYKRIAALQQLGRDTVEAVVWPMSEAAAVLLDRSLRLAEKETALEVGWLLQELARRFELGVRGSTGVNSPRKRFRRAGVSGTVAGGHPVKQVREGRIGA